jgi:hypothetical protein
MTSERSGNAVRFAAAGAALAALLTAAAGRPCSAGARQPPAPHGEGQGAVARQVGTIKAIAGNSITLTTDAGAEVRVTVQESARLVRIEPSAKDLKDAVLLKLAELQVGDRILVRGTQAEDGKTLLAASVIAMKHEDIQAKRQREREDWQRRGAGGLVSAVDPAQSTITISISSLAGKRDVAVRTTKETIVRRYAPDSIKFDDAKPGALAEIKPGDQLRARGNRSADGNEIAAEEIVSGTFRNIAGTVSAIDPAAGTITVNDLATKKPVVVKITTESQVRKLPPMVATGIAMRLKAAAGDSPQGAAAGGGAAGAGAPPAGGAQPGGPGAQRSAGAGGGRGGDLQQMLSRLPAATIADLQKGDAVMIVTTEGTAAAGVTVITLLSGVEPILTANGSQAMNLSPWTIGAGAPEGPGNP